MRGISRIAVRQSAGALLVLSVLWASSATGWAQSSTGNDESDLVSSQVQALLDVLARSDAQSDAAVLAVEALQANDQLSLALREQTLHEFALRLREAPESAAGRRALQWLTGYQSQVLVQSEDRGPAIIPKWRVAGVAQGTLALWDRASASAGLQRQLRAGTMDLAAELAKAESAQDATALTQVLETAPTEQLLATRDRLLSALERSDSQAPAVAAAALRLQDAELCYAVFASGDRRTATQLIAGIGETLPADKAFPILRTASWDENLASAAIMEIGRSAAALPVAQDFLLDALADPIRGGSAAAALAAMESDEMVADVAAVLGVTDDRNLQSRAVLMLVLDDSPLAREGLSEFAQRRDVSAQLRQEVLTWLGEGPQ